MLWTEVKCRRHNPKNLGSFITFVLFRWHQRFHFYIFVCVLLIAALVSYHQPFGVLFNMKHIVPERPSIEPYRSKIIDKQKEEQQRAYDWLDNLQKNPRNFSSIISNKTEQSHFYDFIQLNSDQLNISNYKLFEKPKRNLSNIQTLNEEHIVISVLYSQQDTDHRQGKFYVGQVLYHLLKNHHSRFIVTLCENNNSVAQVSNEIHLIRKLVPVFIVNTFPSASLWDMYEQEKQAHLQCILANFQSFPNMNYFLLLQDDAEPIDENFYQHLLFLIEHRIAKQWPLKGTRRHPAYIKIYHPKWLIDYLHPSFYIVVQLIATGLFLTFVLFTGVYLIQSIFHETGKNAKNRSAQLFRSHIDTLNNQTWCRLSSTHFLLYFLLITVVLFLCNHTNVSWKWRSLHPSFYAIYPAPSCCLPGVLFFRDTYLQIVDYLYHIRCRNRFAIDTAFDELPKHLPLRTYLVEPNLVHHIGLYSRLRHTYINPYLLD